MKSFIFIFISTLFLGLTITVLSAPISRDVSVPDLAKDLGLCTLVTILSFGTVVLSHCIQGAIANNNNRKAIDHYFDELRKFEAEKGYVPRNRTYVKINQHASVSGSESGYESNAM
jgi:hypothetical protein